MFRAVTGRGTARPPPLRRPKSRPRGLPRNFGGPSNVEGPGIYGRCTRGGGIVSTTRGLDGGPLRSDPGGADGRDDRNEDDGGAGIDDGDAAPGALDRRTTRVSTSGAR